METARHDNDSIYREVWQSGLGALYCLGAETYGRWGQQAIKLVPELCREATRGLHVRVRRGTALLLQRRWFGILGIGLQRGISHIIANNEGADLIRTQLEPAAFFADLVAI